MGSKDHRLVRIPIPPKLTLADPAYNPAFDIPQYEWKTIGQFNREREVEWLKEHSRASALIVNQDGTPLYALYKSPGADHDEMVGHLFKTLRANMLNEWEED